MGGADLTSAVLLRVRASAVVGTPSHLPTGWRLYHQILFGPGANLNGLDLSGLDLSGFDLTGAALASTTVTGTGFAGATLTQVYSGSIVGTPASLPSPWSIVGGFLVGPTASLSFAHLDGLDLSGATLDHASLTGASLVGTDLTARDLTGATLSSANLTDAHLAGATLDNAAVTFANLTRADLTGAVAHAADLSGSTLTSAKLGAADLSTSVLQAVVSGSVTGTPAALPASWHLVHGYLVGPGADLSQPILFPQECEAARAWTGKGSVQWTELSWLQNPQQAHIIKALAGLPVVETGPAMMMEGALVLKAPLARVLE